MMLIHLWLALVAVLFALPPAQLALSWCTCDRVSVPVILQGELQRRFAAGELGLSAQLVDMTWRPPPPRMPPVGAFVRGPGGAQ